MEYIRCPRCKNDIPTTYIFCPFCGFDLRFIIREKLITRLSLKDRIYRIYYLFRMPLESMKHIASAPDFLGAVLVSIIGAALLFIKSIAVYLEFIGSLSRESLIYLFLNALVLQFILWFVFAMFFHIALSIVGGKGTFGDVVNVLGYSMIFVNIGHVFSLILMSIASSTPDSPSLLPVYAYVPFIFISAILAGYGFSYTHLLKKSTAISTAIVVSIFFIVFLCVL
mgnify:CR=1 FL=1